MRPRSWARQPPRPRGSVPPIARAPRPLRGRIVAITGGARGIGRAAAAALAREGARVAIGDIDAAAARAAAEDIGSGTLALELDVTDRASFEAFLDRVEARLGPLDVMINNAGILHLGPFVDEDETSQVRQIDINLHGPITGTKLALRRMRPRGRGHIVNVASSAGKFTAPGIATYTATKHGVVGFTEAVRWEQRGSGIELSIVMPGIVRTEMIAGYKAVRGVQEVEPEDVAAAIVDALMFPRVEVFVPQAVGRIWRMLNLVPRRVREAVLRAMRVDQVTWHADRSARAAYETRAAASEPKLDAGGEEASANSASGTD
jgi:NAD(P)-dependent dehydrogenase (short-subunit alcohol dehydrogenase family)